MKAERKKRLGRMIAAASLTLAASALSALTLWMLICKPTPEQILEDSIINYHYFFKGSEIDYYSNTGSDEGHSINIKTVLAHSKIPELVKTRILTSCEGEEVSCHTSNGDNSEKKCITAMLHAYRRREKACINIKTGSFDYSYTGIHYESDKE